MLSIKIIHRQKDPVCGSSEHCFLEHSGITVAAYPECSHKYTANGMTRLTPNFSHECHTLTDAVARVPSLQSPGSPSQLDAIKGPLHHKPRPGFLQQMFLSKNSLVPSYSVIWYLNKSLTRWSCHILSHHSMFKECLICKSTQWFCKRRLLATRMLNRDYVRLVTITELNILTQFLDP